MKKYKLKKEVKETLLVLLIIGIILMYAFVNSRMTNKAVEQCVNAGHEYNYCVEGVR